MRAMTLLLKLLSFLSLTVAQQIFGPPQRGEVIMTTIGPVASESTITDELIDIKVGVMIPRYLNRLTDIVGYQTSASAVLVAVDRVRREHLLDRYNFTFIFAFDECNEPLAVGLAVDFITKKNVSVIVGPTCNDPAIAVGVIGTYYNFPVFLWGPTSSAELEEQSRFPTVAAMTASSYSLGIALREVMGQYGWDEFALVYSTKGDFSKCNYFKSDIENAIADVDGVVISVNTKFDDITDSEITDTLLQIKSRARIVVICLVEDDDKRRVMLGAYDNGMVSDEYVYIFAESETKGFLTGLQGAEQPIWQDTDKVNDGRDRDAFEAFRRVLVMSQLQLESTGERAENYSEFGKDVIRRMREPPFACTQECSREVDQHVSLYAGQLHDAFYLYAYALNQTYLDDPKNGLANGTMIIENAKTSFDGMSGRVIINDNGSREPEYFVSALNSSGGVEVYASVRVSGRNAVSFPTSTHIRHVLGTFAARYKDEASTIWDTRGGQRPRSIPRCGFDGRSCPVNFVQAYLVYVVVGAFILFVVITAAFTGIGFTIYSRMKENERLNMMWNIPFVTLAKPQHKNKTLESSRSLQSGPSSTSTKLTMESKQETKNFAFFYLNKDPVVAHKHHTKVRLDQQDFVEMRQMRQMESDNLNRFIGMTIDGPLYMSLWKYCARGSLQDVIAKGSMTMDSFFVFSLLRDIAAGISFLHHSFLGCHGHLTSEACLIDDRWQIKLSYYGLRAVRRSERRSKKELLWTAPELLRNEDPIGTKEGDIYSFAIICSEVMTKTPAWDLDNRKERPEEIIYMLKKGTQPPLRPQIALGENQDINPAMLHLVKDCWSESPENRPKIDTIRSLMKSMHSGRNDNLMDHVFNMLEQYASTLEEEVEERTKELVEEKKKSDVLLYRMLPRQVAEKLKLGQSVEPEHFDSVTIFFSDVVSFTKLAARCTPLQVVNLLNDLYTVFDNIIDEHDVYKVETIGDGYLCVSGLPHRNGHEHVREICNMSLSFMRSLHSFRIAHLPNERINLRIGIHTGSCVAGVVGLTMPRYCLFGDSVNTASRMESNGKPGHIHLSVESNELLMRVFGGYVTECRGEVIIKGKGVMETYWLVGRKESRDGIPGAASMDGTAVAVSSSPPSTRGGHRSTTAMTAREPMYDDYRRRDGDEDEQDNNALQQQLPPSNVQVDDLSRL